VQSARIARLAREMLGAIDGAKRGRIANAGDPTSAAFE
jgi:hypothetical protein